MSMSTTFFWYVTDPDQKYTKPAYQHTYICMGKFNASYSMPITCFTEHLKLATEKSRLPFKSMCDSPAAHGGWSVLMGWI